MKIFRYFKKSEFECKCGCGGNVEDKLIEKLDLARDIAGIPFIINSGYRCKKHNENVGGTDKSSHIKGLAVDIDINGSRDRFIVVDALLKAGFERIGVKYDDLLVHADIDEEKSRKVMW